MISQVIGVSIGCGLWSVLYTVSRNRYSRERHWASYLFFYLHTLVTDI